MKKIKIFTMICLMIILNVFIQSCADDFLDLEPRMNEFESSAYVTEEDAFSALVIVYNGLAVQPWNFVPIQSDIFSDDAFSGGEGSSAMDEWQCQERSVIPAENNGSNNLWNKLYSANYRANQYLANEADINWVTSGLRDRMKAEVLTIRAYTYWDLVRHFGSVPIISELIANPEDYKSIPQSTPKEIYDFILSDLLAAMPDLPLTVSASEKGRITKDVARMLIARMYMYYEGFVKPVMGASGDWQSGETIINKVYVQTMLDEILSSGRYRLLDNYADVFDWGNENNAESIFEFQYNNTALSNGWGWGTAGNFSVVFYGVRSPIGDPNTVAGWSFAVPTWSLYNEFEPNDTIRRDVSIYDASKHLSGYVKGWQNTGYFNHKYMPNALYESTLGGDSRLNWCKNYIDMRLAEVYLMAAELYLTDNPAKGLGYLNEVRTRAMGEDAALTLAEFNLDAIYHELRVEFAGEGHRKWDLLRRGLDYAKTKIDASWDIPAGVPNINDFVGREFKIDTWGMIPIPAGEIELANPGVLKQNVPAFQ